METPLLAGIKSPSDLKQIPIDDLPDLAREIRHVICEQVSQSGGHLAPNLGVVDLTIALHYVFDLGPDGDRLLFDVGHQCYPHKLLTGRFDRFHKLRQAGGLSGFPEPRESGHDLFAVGHAGTAVSTAVGMARGDELTGEAYRKDNPDGRRVVALVGDASIVNGLAMEGLNNAGTLKRQLLVVLNDNGMSIAKPQGAVAQYFGHLRINQLFTGFKQQAKRVLSRVPGGMLVGEAYRTAGDLTKVLLAEDSWFEKFGLVTVGPVDGHDLPNLIRFLIEARDFERPMLLHAKTIKGKGYEFAEEDATTFHSPKPFVVNGCRVELKKSGRSFTAAFGDALVDLMERDEAVVAATAAMPDGTGVSKAMAEFPKRTWDTGICESHAMDMMAGLAKSGLKPFFAVYSTFLQRGFDQAFQEVALQGLPVRLCLDRAGLVGGDGAVHHGFCDIALLSIFPDAALLAAIDEPSLRAALEFMRTYDEGLSAVRYPRDGVSDLFTEQDCPPFELGKARALVTHEAPDAAILAYGTTAVEAAAALDELTDEYRVDLYDARFAKPIDIDLVRDVLERGVPILTLEDHGLRGGFGSLVLAAAHGAGLDTRLIRCQGIPETWIYQGSRPGQLAQAGLDAASIARRIREMLDEDPPETTDLDSITPAREETETEQPGL
jgi:1-deoxy-D-xylulose-5-phosphate synthase